MIVSTATNAQYNVAKPGSVPQRITGRMRRSLYAPLSFERCAAKPQEAILDVGATSDRVYDFSNYIEAWYPHKSRITAVGIDDAKFLEELYPGVTFLKADGRHLPFEDEAFDVVHSSAVLEHVGSRESQMQFIRELTRVARRAVFHDDAEPLVSRRSAYRTSICPLAARSLVSRHSAPARAQYAQPRRESQSSLRW